MGLPHLFLALVPILATLGFLLWKAFGLSTWHACFAGLGMALLPMGIVAALAWRERARKP